MNERKKKYFEIIQHFLTYLMPYLLTDSFFLAKNRDKLTDKHTFDPELFASTHWIECGLTDLVRRGNAPRSGSRAITTFLEPHCVNFRPSRRSAKVTCRDCRTLFEICQGKWRKKPIRERFFGFEPVPTGSLRLKPVFKNGDVTKV